MKSNIKDIEGYEGKYKITSSGKIWSAHLNGHMATCNDAGGYVRVVLTKNSKKKTFKVHRLVMSAFVGKSTLSVDHKNGDKTDNRLKNLEYVTDLENSHRRVLRTYGKIKRIDQRKKYAA